MEEGLFFSFFFRSNASTTNRKGKKRKGKRGIRNCKRGRERERGEARRQRINLPISGRQSQLPSSPLFLSLSTSFSLPTSTPFFSNLHRTGSRAIYPGPDSSCDAPRISRSLHASRSGQEEIRTFLCLVCFEKRKKTFRSMQQFERNVYSSRIDP